MDSLHRLQNLRTWIAINRKAMAKEGGTESNPELEQFTTQLLRHIDDILYAIPSHHVMPGSIIRKYNMYGVPFIVERQDEKAVVYIATDQERYDLTDLLDSTVYVRLLEETRE